LHRGWRLDTKVDAAIAWLLLEPVFGATPEEFDESFGCTGFDASFGCASVGHVS
jgi:hypothetical protein